MNLLEVIKDNDFPENLHAVRTREASRAIVFDDTGLIPILFVSKYEYHKFPGGSINLNESRLEALEREVKEETGCGIQVKGEVGEIIEYRSKENFEIESHLRQKSYCYSGKIISKGEPNFTEEEKRDGFELVWMNLEQAIYRIENDKPNNFEGAFIKKRALTFLNKVKYMIRRNDEFNL